MILSTNLSSASHTFLLFAFGLLLPKITNAMPLDQKHWTHEVGPHAHCMTMITPEDRAEFHKGLLESRNQLSERDVQQETFVFNVSFNVVYTNETLEGGYVPDSHIQDQMKTLNQDYNSTGISWVLVNTTRIHNPEWFVHAGPESPLEEEMKKTYNVGDATTLNVYTLTFNSSTKSLGSASIPSAYFRFPKQDGVSIRHTTVTGGSREHFNLGRTLTHEVGHWLGLFHTFEGGCDNGVGDNIADTPPARSGSEGCPVGRDSCPGDGPDLINNFMDYSYDSCMTAFTKGQGERMREAARAFRRPGGKTMASTSAATRSSTSSITAATTRVSDPAPLSADVVV